MILFIANIVRTFIVMILILRKIKFGVLYKMESVVDEFNDLLKFVKFVINGFIKSFVKEILFLIL